MKVISTILMVVGVIGIIILLAIFMGFILFSLDPPIKSQLTPTPVSADAVKSFDQKIATFKQKAEAAIAAKEQKEMVLSVTASEINSKVIELLAQGDLPMKEMSINLNNDLCKVYAVFNNPGINAKTGLVAQLMVSKGTIKIIVIDFQLGRLPLPQSLVKNVGSILDIVFRMEGFEEELSLDITSVTIENDSLTIKGSTKPATK